MRAWRDAALATIALATLTAACSSGPAPGLVGSPDADEPVASETVASSTPEPVSDDPRLWIVEDDQPVEFENGHTLTSNDLDIEIFVAPYPPARSANIDFYVVRDGVPVQDANVTLQFDMTVMEHGPFALNAHPTGGGHYLAPLEFIMTGDFLLNIAFEVGDSEAVVNMFVRAIR